MTRAADIIQQGSRFAISSIAGIKRDDGDVLRDELITDPVAAEIPHVSCARVTDLHFIDVIGDRSRKIRIFAHSTPPEYSVSDLIVRILQSNIIFPGRVKRDHNFSYTPSSRRASFVKVAKRAPDACANAGVLFSGGAA